MTKMRYIGVLIVALAVAVQAEAAVFAFLQDKADEAADDKPAPKANDEATPKADDNNAAQPKPDTDANADKAAQPNNGQAPPADAPAEQLRIQVMAVRGMVRVRQDVDKPWVKAKAGMELSQTAEVRTGLRSAVQIKIYPHQLLTLDRLGTIKVLRAIRKEGELKTDVGMPYGRARYKIQAGGAEHESTIRSPSATLAVRGSDGLAEDYADRPARYVVFNSPSTSLYGRSGYEFPLVRGQIRVDRRSVPDTALADGTVTPGDEDALTDVEVALLEDRPVFGTNLRIDLTRQLVLAGTDTNAGAPLGSPIVTGPFDFQSGDLKFTLNFTGIADVDLDVLDPEGFNTSVFPGVPPGSLRFTPTGGVASADALGPNGMEMITFAGQHLAGPHDVTTRLFEFEGSGAATFNITVTRTLPGGIPQVLDGFDGMLDADMPVFTRTVNVPVSP